jgi:hypothetical protein
MKIIFSTGALQGEQLQAALQQISQISTSAAAGGQGR